MNHPGLRVPRAAYSPAQDRAELVNAAIGRQYPRPSDVLTRQRAFYSAALNAGALALDEIRALEFGSPARLPEGVTAEAEAGLHPLRGFPETPN
jgi:hypothetical protein